MNSQNVDEIDTWYFQEEGQRQHPVHVLIAISYQNLWRTERTLAICLDNVPDFYMLETMKSFSAFRKEENLDILRKKL